MLVLLYVYNNDDQNDYGKDQKDGPLHAFVLVVDQVSGLVEIVIEDHEPVGHP